jgi:hypothetical protein
MKGFSPLGCKPFAMAQLKELPSVLDWLENRRLGQPACTIFCLDSTASAGLMPQ